MADFSKIQAKIRRLDDYLQNEAPIIIGTEAVNHFKESFENQGFTDQTLEKWQEVKRREPSSSWYGFKYGSKTTRPGKTQRGSGGTTNYSPAATIRPILSGETQELMNSIRFQKIPYGARITAGTPYAKLMNEGGPMKVFGKGGAKMPKRQFMGKSEVLIKRISEQLLRDIKNIL